MQRFGSEIFHHQLCKGDRNHGYSYLKLRTFRKCNFLCLQSRFLLMDASEILSNEFVSIFGKFIYFLRRKLFACGRGKCNN